MAGEVIADLVVNIAGNDIQLQQATRAAADAMEALAKQGVSMSANIKYAFTETGVQAESMSVKIQESAEGSTRAMTGMTQSMRTQLQALNATMAELSGTYSKNGAEQLSAMARQAEAAKSLAKQEEAEVAAAARETAQQRIAYEQEAVAQARMAAQERIAIERDVVAQINADARDRLTVERMVDEEIAAMNKIFVTRTMNTIKQVAAERKAANSAAIASDKAVMDGIKGSLGIFGQIGKAGIDLGETFVKIGTTIFGAGSEATAALGPIGAVAGVAASAVTSAFGKAIDILKSVTKAVGEVTLGIAAIGTAVLVAAAKFDQLMLRTVTMAQAPISELGRMKQAVLDLSSEVGQTPDNMAKALYHIESLGKQGSEALELLKRSAQEASMSGANLEDVATAMGAVARVQFRDVAKGANAAADAASYLNTITGIGNMTMQDLTSAIGTGILPTLKEAGLGMRDFGAAIALATDNAEPANQAATRLRQTLSMISTAALQTKKIDAFASIGMQADQMANDLKRPDGLLYSINDLKAHLIGTFGPDAVNQLKTYNQIMESDGQAAADEWAAHASKAAQVVNEIFGGARSSGMINMLVDQSGQLAINYQKIGNEQDRNARFAQSWKEQTQQLSQQWQQFKAWIESVAISLGEKLIPWVQKGIGFLKQMGQDIIDAWGGDKTTNLGKEFMTQVRQLAADFIPWLKKELMDLRDWIVQNKDRIDNFGRVIVQVVLPAMKDLAEKGIHLIIETVKWLMNAILDLTDAWNKHHTAIIVILKILLAAAVVVFGGILAAATLAFGWVPIIGDKLIAANKKFYQFAQDVNAALDSIDKDIVINFYGKVSGPAGSLIATGDSTFNTTGRYALVRAAAMGGPTPANEPFLVGENGPELLYLNTSGYVIPNHEMASHMGARSGSASLRPVTGGPGGGMQLVEAHVYLDGQELYGSTIRLAQRYKRRNGGTGVN